VEMLLEVKSSERPADWVWFMTWHSNYLTDENSVEDLYAVYNDDYVITLDELPVWS